MDCVKRQALVINEHFCSLKGSKTNYIPNKCQETSKGLQNVGIRGSRFTDGGAQFSIAQRPDHRKYPSNGPHHQGQAK